MENKFKNQILSEELQNITIENQEEPSKHGEEEETEDTTRYGEFGLQQSKLCMGTNVKTKRKCKKIRKYNKKERKIEIK